MNQKRSPRPNLGQKNEKEEAALGYDPLVLGVPVVEVALVQDARSAED